MVGDRGDTNIYLLKDKNQQSADRKADAWGQTTVQRTNLDWNTGTQRGSIREGAEREIKEEIRRPRKKVGHVSEGKRLEAGARGESKEILTDISAPVKRRGPTDKRGEDRLQKRFLGSGLPVRGSQP